VREACPGFERPNFDAKWQNTAVLIRDEREARPCFDDARDFRARFLKIHKRYRLAIRFAVVRVSHEKKSYRHGDPSVHKLVCKALMSRGEFRSRNCISGAARRQNI
jgi:hypothetical protein